MLELTWFKGVLAALGILAGLIVAVISTLKANTRVKNAHAKREEALADAAKARAKRDEVEAALAESRVPQSRLSIPPESLDVLALLRQELGALRQDLMERISRLSGRIDHVDTAHDETAKAVSKLEGRMNGKH